MKRTLTVLCAISVACFAALVATGGSSHLDRLARADGKAAKPAEAKPAEAKPAEAKPAEAAKPDAPKPETPLTALPYTPSLSIPAMDRSVDPCTDFYSYSCGGWMKANPIPPDQVSWSVYGKLQDENERFLWGILAEAAKGGHRSADEQKIGDYFAACMDTAAIEKLGLQPIQPQLDAFAALKSVDELPPLLAEIHLSHGSGLLFGFGADQDPGNAEQVIAFAGAGGLGLPDRDYYTKTDARSIDIRKKYVAHVATMLGLIGEAPAVAKSHADKILAFETALAKASLTRVEKRDPHKLYHKLSRRDLQAMTPAFKWDPYLSTTGAGDVQLLNVTEPAFFKAVGTLLKKTPLDTLKAYLRWQLVSDSASYLPAAIDDADFAFFHKFLRGAEVQEPRWKRCVQWVDRDLGEALGAVFVKRTFKPEVKQRTLAMTVGIEKAMESEIEALPWMGAETKQQALLKLHKMVNKIGYPDKPRDYGAVEIKVGDFIGNAERAAAFETHRQLAKIGRPVDRGEWLMTAPTVNAYYNPAMNDINFPAGVLQPPLFDFKLDDAPNYGNTGATVGHELTHGFDDEGRQFDAAGNLRDWWTAKDASEFEKRAQCVVDQYAKYMVVDDIKINSKLTLGEDVADLGGTMLAYMAWRHAVRGQMLKPIDGFSPEQRFFIGMAQWACNNERPENLRLMAITNPHSPGKYRINGVVANLPEFGQAFACKPGQPMMREKPCRVW